MTSDPMCNKIPSVYKMLYLSGKTSVLIVRMQGNIKQYSQKFWSCHLTVSKNYSVLCSVVVKDCFIVVYHHQKREGRIDDVKD